MAPLERTYDCSLLLIYRSRKDERLSWPSWLTSSGRFTHITSHSSDAGRAQDRESSSAKNRRSTTVPRHQPGWLSAGSSTTAAAACQSSTSLANYYYNNNVHYFIKTENGCKSMTGNRNDNRKWKVSGTGVGLDRIFIFVVSDPSILPIWPLLIAL